MISWRKQLVAIAVILVFGGVSTVAMAQEAEDEEVVEQQGEEAEPVDDEAENEEGDEDEEEDEEPREDEDEADDPDEPVETEVADDRQRPDDLTEDDEEEVAEDRQRPDDLREDDEERQRPDDLREDEEEVAEERRRPDDLSEDEEEQEVDEEEVTDEEDPWEDVDEPTDQQEVVQQEDEEEEEDEEDEQEVAEEEEEDEDEEEEEEEPFAPTFAAGAETGIFFTDLARFNDYILEPNDREQFDILGTQHIDLVAESEVFENIRMSILGGATFSWQSDPSLFGWYVGVEPAYVAGDERWEMAIGISGSVGGMRIRVDDDQVAMSLVTLRPFFEGRHKFNEQAAGYIRIGFNQWYPRNPRSETLDLESPRGDGELTTVDLSTGGLYVAAGARFGALEGIAEPEELEPTQQDDQPDQQDDGESEEES